MVRVVPEKCRNELVNGSWMPIPWSYLSKSGKCKKKDQYACLIEVDEEEGETCSTISSENELDIARIDRSSVMEPKEHISHRTCSVHGRGEVFEQRGQLCIASFVEGEVKCIDISRGGAPVKSFPKYRRHKAGPSDSCGGNAVLRDGDERLWVTRGPDPWRRSVVGNRPSRQG